MTALSQLTLPVKNASTGEVSNQTFVIKSGNVSISEATLSAGSTSVVFSNIQTRAGDIIQFGTSKAGLDYNDVTVSNSSTSGGVTTATYTVTFDAQSSAVTVYLIKTEG